MGGFLGQDHACSRRARPIRSASIMPRGSPTSGSRWSATPRTRIHPIAGQGLNLGFRDAAALAQVLVEGARLGLDLGDRPCSTATSAGAASTPCMVAAATDSLTRIYGVRGKTASAVRRFGMGLIDRIGPVKNRLMAEARGTSGDLPLLLRGLPI